MFGQNTWEEAESRLQEAAAKEAIRKAGLEPGQVRYAFSGDLLGQLIATSFGLKELGIPVFGLYGACSTMTESLGLAATLVGAGAAEYSAAVSSSHFCSAERQFRFPLNYGGQRTPTAQWTVTGAGALVVGKSKKKNMPRVHAATFGKIEDLGITDINNMGAAMAPAAASTLYEFLKDSGTRAEDYDLILTGDLGKLGSDLLIRIMMDNDINIRDNHNDCGKMIFDSERQDTHCGGSGCGCCASVLCSKILKDIEEGKLKNVLVMATGALMSTVSVQQGESIPAVAHLVNIKGE